MIEWIGLSVGLLAIYTVRADFSRYSIFTAGVFKRVSRKVVETEKECEESLCENTVFPGEERRWFKEIVVAGMPVARYSGGVHYYCEDHVAFEVIGDLENPPTPKTERLAISLFEAVGEFLTTLPDSKSENEDPFRNVTTSTASALDLMPVVLLILVAALILSLVKGVPPSSQ